MLDVVDPAALQVGRDQQRGLARLAPCRRLQFVHGCGKLLQTGHVAREDLDAAEALPLDPAEQIRGEDGIGIAEHERLPEQLVVGQSGGERPHRIRAVQCLPERHWSRGRSRGAGCLARRAALHAGVLRLRPRRDGGCRGLGAARYAGGAVPISGNGLVSRGRRTCQREAGYQQADGRHQHRTHVHRTAHAVTRAAEARPGNPEAQRPPARRSWHDGNGFLAALCIAMPRRWRTRGPRPRLQPRAAAAQ